MPSWKGAKRVAIDTETKDPHLKALGPSVRRGGYIVGVSFAIEDGPCHYLPYRHQGGDNLDEDGVKSYLSDQLKSHNGIVTGANLSYDIDYMAEDELKFHPDVTFRDVQVADPIINELEHSYSLENICARWGIPGKDTDLLERAASAFGVDHKGGLWKLPARYVGAYAEADADRPLRVLRRQERVIDENDLWQIFNLECDVLPVLVRMRRRGVLIDQDKLEQIETWSLEEEAKALAVVKRDTGITIEVGNVWKADLLAQALSYIGVKFGTTSTGKPSIDQALLKSTPHPVAKAILWARKTNKIRTTFAKSMREHMVNGRIHCTFNQTARETEAGDQRGVRYGRLSAIDPNLQQQPNPDKDPAIAGEWRKICKPEPGTLWACDDYSQMDDALCCRDGSSRCPHRRPGILRQPRP
jgi:DNA polymerase I-like protein with 3'-5' exonuclease and polymerase domains